MYLVVMLIMIGLPLCAMNLKAQEDKNFICNSKKAPSIKLNNLSVNGSKYHGTSIKECLKKSDRHFVFTFGVNIEDCIFITSLSKYYFVVPHVFEKLNHKYQQQICYILFSFIDRMRFHEHGMNREREDLALHGEAAALFRPTRLAIETLDKQELEALWEAFLLCREDIQGFIGSVELMEEVLRRLIDHAASLL